MCPWWKSLKHADGYVWWYVWMVFYLNISDGGFAKNFKIVGIVFILFDDEIKEIWLFIFIFKFKVILNCWILSF